MLSPKSSNMQEYFYGNVRIMSKQHHNNNSLSSASTNGSRNGMIEKVVQKSTLRYMEIMTDKLFDHMTKHSKMILKVELPCIDDNGEIPVRPTLESMNGEDEDVDNTPKQNGVRPKPIVGRHLGERHLIILPSLIHGQGLFTANDIKAGEMIIEYAGEVVSSRMALERQNWYIKRQINNYVMHIDRELHIDATNEGNCSRFINHSCEPNCTAEILNIRGLKRVLIIALKDIRGGDELTYDYSFTSDELVPCYCGMESCRLFLNHNIAKLKLKATEIKSILKAHKDQD